MYDPSKQGSAPRRAASMAASITVNLGIFAGFAAFATMADNVPAKRATVTAFNIGAMAEPQSGATATPPPPPPPETKTAEQADPVTPTPAEPAMQAKTDPSTVPVRMAKAHPPRKPIAVQPFADGPMQAVSTAALTQTMPVLQQASLTASAPNAAAAAAPDASDSYGAQIKRHLLRFRRQNTVGPGSAFIRFVILPDGKVDGIGVAQSSGSSRFDREAMQIVRRAVPFPNPPKGNSRSFNFEFTGR